MTGCGGRTGAFGELRGWADRVGIDEDSPEAEGREEPRVAADCGGAAVVEASVVPMPAKKAAAVGDVAEDDSGVNMRVRAAKRGEKEATTRERTWKHAHRTGSDKRFKSITNKKVRYLTLWIKGVIDRIRQEILHLNKQRVSHCKCAVSTIEKRWKAEARLTRDV
jgi:hypothetical protein